MASMNCTYTKSKSMLGVVYRGVQPAGRLKRHCGDYDRALTGSRGRRDVATPVE